MFTYVYVPRLPTFLFFYQLQYEIPCHCYPPIMHVSWIFFACIRPEISPLAGNCTPLIGDRMEPRTGKEEGVEERKWHDPETV